VTFTKNHSDGKTNPQHSGNEFNPQVKKMSLPRIYPTYQQKGLDLHRSLQHSAPRRWGEKNMNGDKTIQQRW
jgi:hypothetical protein